MPEDPELRLGALVTADRAASPLPLRHTQVEAAVTGPLADVTVTQEFSNPFPAPVELAYLFPLPHAAAIYDFTLAIGARVIQAEIEERAEARARYEGALAAGRRSALLEAQRSSLFTVKLANVQPGEQVRATVRYQERLRFADGQYQFVFPMGVTPRYHADATPVAAPVTLDNLAVGDVSVRVTVDAGARAGAAESPSHPIAITPLPGHRFAVALAEPAIPNRDFVLRYTVAGDAVSAAAWTSARPDGTTALLVTALPPRGVELAEPAPREFIFVLDRSGSMMGGPLEQAKNALKACLRALGPADSFSIQAFDHLMEWFTDGAVAVTQATVEAADRWLGTVDARGGTEISAAVHAALRLPADPGRQRYVVFLTDGAAYREETTLAEVHDFIGRARLFTFGIGPAVNRGLLSKMAELGRGTAEFLQLDEDIEAAIIRFQDRVAFPILQDLRLVWEFVRPEVTYPEALPDLYVGQTLELAARLAAFPPGPGRLTIRGRSGTAPVSLEVAIPAPSGPNPAVDRALARAQLDGLQQRLPGGEAQVAQELISLSRQYRLLTPLTAFVAVDSDPTGKGEGRPARVDVALPLPEGLQIEGFLGGPPPVPMAMAAPSMRRAVSFASAAAPDDDIDVPSFLRRRSGPGVSHQAAPAPEAPADPLRVLARSQNVSGSWGAGPDEVELTAVAVLAFVRAGHTTRTGHYRRQLLRAVQWLQAAPAQGFDARALAQALAEMGAATGDSALTGALAGFPPLGAPPAGRVHRLDDLRLAALHRAPVTVDQALLDGPQGALARAWLTAL
jgi:Ca-activated chloride channel family protein